MRRLAIFAAGLVTGLLLNKWTRAVLHAYGYVLLVAALLPLQGCTELAAAILAGDRGPHPCGTERLAVKTLSDPDAARVDMNPTHITIPVLAAFKLHGKVKGNEPRGIEDEEFQTFQLDAIVVDSHAEADRDYHLVLKDDDTDVTMIGESVDPVCARGADPIVLAHIAEVRQAILEAGGLDGLIGKRVHVSGAAFFDRIHGQSGRARNGIELHPLLSLEVR